VPGFIYLGTSPPNTDVGTQALLLGAFGAIWTPPPGFRPGLWPQASSQTPQGGDSTWLVWRTPPMGPDLLLGAGRLIAARTPRYGLHILWTNGTAPGIVQASVNAGYPDVAAASFARIDRPISAGSPYPTVIGGGLKPGWNPLTASMEKAMQALCPIAR
jgi:hypothetical protein